MDSRRKCLKDIVAANVDILVAAQDTSEARIASKGLAPQKNFNNARNARNITLDTLEGIARSFGIPAWKLLLADMNSEEALKHSKRNEAYDQAPKHVQRSIDVLLGLREAKGDDEDQSDDA